MDTVSFLNLLILFITLIVIIFYTIETRKLRIINNRIFKLEEDKLKPQIIAFFDPNPKDYAIRFIIKNVGGGTAFSIFITFIPQFNFGDEQLEKYIKNRKIFKEGLSVLNPDETFEMIVGYTIQASEHYNKSEIPIQYEIELKFRDIYGNEYQIKRTASIHQFFDRIVDKPNEVVYLEKINKVLEDMNRNISKLNLNK